MVVIMDLEEDEAVVEGIGCVTLLRNDAEMIFERGQPFPLDVLRGTELGEEGWIKTELKPAHSGEGRSADEGDAFWDQVHAVEKDFQEGLEKHDMKRTINGLLELDQAIWNAKADLESDEFISQARDILRQMVVSLGVKLETSPENKKESLAPLVERVLKWFGPGWWLWAA